MTLDLLHAFLAVLALGGALAAVGSSTHAARLSAELATHRGLAESRARSFALIARDMNGIGLALLGRAQHLGQEAGLAFEGDARQLLALADAAAEEGAGAAPARNLVEERFALAPVLQEAVAIAGAQLGPGTRHWRITPNLEGLSVTADRRALRGAVVQVLGRAARATMEGDFIDIRADLRPHAASIIVEDEGVGVAVEELSPALHDGAPERTRGLGFGLSLARSLLRAHGGELVIEAAPGIGARAFLSLPPERMAAMDQAMA
ncbi:sensor histidine kinase KdpD [Roseococcus sp. SYP-B2431]|uniref:sensor histidine kinase n=1 Tax=Roseococcus sp. SYP-B2431 TaxID=2496640 RepID=UPI0013F40C18|nr:ATP-binding protein [Roseococcus sp. SYP-B2431]